MSIHAEAMKMERLLFGEPGKGRTPDDGTYYGSGKRAGDLHPSLTCARPGKTREDKRSGAWGNRFANRQDRSGRGTGGARKKPGR